MPTPLTPRSDCIVHTVLQRNFIPIKEKYTVEAGIQTYIHNTYTNRLTFPRTMVRYDKMGLGLSYRDMFLHRLKMHLPNIANHVVSASKRHKSYLERFTLPFQISQKRVRIFIKSL